MATKKAKPKLEPLKEYKKKKTATPKVNKVIVPSKPRKSSLQPIRSEAESKLNAKGRKIVDAGKYNLVKDKLEPIKDYKKKK